MSYKWMGTKTRGMKKKRGERRVEKSELKND